MIIIQNAQSGRFQGKVTESQLIDLMNQMSEIDSKDSKIEIKRQKFDDDEELDIDNMGFWWLEFNLNMASVMKNLLLSEEQTNENLECNFG